MEKSFPFNAHLTADGYDRTYSADDLAAERAAYISDGILTMPSLKITPKSGLTITVSDGMACIKGHTYWNTDPIDFTLPISNASLSRKDRIVLRLDLVNRQIELAMKTGTPSITPEEPPLTDSEMIREIPLATITVGINASVVTSADIADDRISASYPINFKELIDEYTAELRSQLGVDDLCDLKLIATNITVTGDGGSVLYNDGVYRKSGVLHELVRFTSTGNFSTSAYPSTNNLYHVMLLGAGANGVYTNHLMGIFSGGGSGAMVNVGPINIAPGTYPVKVGTPTVVSSPETTGETTAFGYTAKGADMGDGGAGPYSLPGANGTPNGNGASTPYGSGGIYGGNINATGYGAGGSAPAHGITGQGSGGLVIVYGYR